MNFNTQVCTTREQSERLLALGLKKETADMCLDEVIEGEWSPMAFPAIFKSQRPAWSLHRLIAMYCSGLISCQYNLAGLSFDGLIGHIEAAIKTDKFNEDYLNKQP